MKIKNDVQVWKKFAYEIQSNFPFKYLQKMIDPSAQKGGGLQEPGPFQLILTAVVLNVGSMEAHRLRNTGVFWKRYLLVVLIRKCASSPTM